MTLINYWSENVELDKEFGNLPRLYCPNHLVAVCECFIEWSEPQEAIVAVLSSTLVDKGPSNPNQEVHLIVQNQRVSRFYHTQCHQPIRYKITNYDLDLSSFTISLLHVSNKTYSNRAPTIERVSLKLDITDARVPS